LYFVKIITQKYNLTTYSVQYIMLHTTYSGYAYYIELIYLLEWNVNDLVYG